MKALFLCTTYSIIPQCGRTGKSPLRSEVKHGAHPEHCQRQARHAGVYKHKPSVTNEPRALSHGHVTSLLVSGAHGKVGARAREKAPTVHKRGVRQREAERAPSPGTWCLLDNHTLLLPGVQRCFRAPMHRRREERQNIPWHAIGWQLLREPAPVLLYEKWRGARKLENRQCRGRATAPRRIAVAPNS